MITVNASTGAVAVDLANPLITPGPVTVTGELTITGDVVVSSTTGITAASGQGGYPIGTTTYQVIGHRAPAATA